MKLLEMLKLVDSDEKKIVIKGNSDIEIDGLNLCNRESEKKKIVSYVTSGKYKEIVKNAVHVFALFVTKNDGMVYEAQLLQRGGCILICDNPEKMFYELHEALCKNELLYEQYDFASIVGQNCNIAESAVIENGVIIRDNVTIGPNTVVRKGTIIESNSIIGCNTTIGSEGFQLIINGEATPLHATHAGRCHIGSNVYIGDNTCVCNSLFEGETYIADDVKIDNLCHIAHNLKIGKNAVITAHVILCGSSVIEEGAWIAPNSSVLNRVVVGKYAKVGMGSVVTRDVAPYTTVYGIPARVHEK